MNIMHVRSSRNIHMFHSFHGYDEFNKLTCSQRMGVIAQLVEHCSAIAKAMGSNPVEAPKTFSRLNCECLNRSHNCDDHTFISRKVVLDQRSILHEHGLQGTPVLGEKRNGISDLHIGSCITCCRRFLLSRINIDKETKILAKRQ